MARLFTPIAFSATLEKVRVQVPAHMEWPDRIEESEARTFLDMLRNVSKDVGNGRAARMEFEGMAAALSARDLAVLARCLTLPEAMEAISIWEPLLKLRLGKSLYLQLRAMLQFFPDAPALRHAFWLAASEVRPKPLFVDRVLSMMRSSRDDLLALPEGADPVEEVLRALLASGTLVGIYATDQELARHSTLFRRMREGFFARCHPDAYVLNRQELHQCLDGAEEAERNRILAHFLNIHTAAGFPIPLSFDLIERYGIPETDWEESTWQEAERSRRFLGGQAAEVPPRSIPPVLTAQILKYNGLRGFQWWYRLERMRTHFGADSLKMEVLTPFLPQLEGVSTDTEHEALLLHFGDITVIDFLSVSSFSWVCDAAELDLRYDEMVAAMLSQGDVTGIRRQGRIPEAKDFVIEQEGGTAIRLTFAEVGKLYAMDLLAIRLGLMEREIWGDM